MLTAAGVKAKARELGADLVGIAAADVAEHHPIPGQTHTPKQILKGARSVVVVARRLLWGMTRELDPRNRNVHYAGEMALSTLEGMCYELTRFLEDHRSPAILVPAAYSRSHQIEVAAKTLSLPHFAVEAGLGTLGLNLQLLTPRYGPRVILCAVITTAELEADGPIRQALCRGESCGRCLLTCPGDAVGHFDLDLERCRPHSSPYGYHFVEGRVEKFLAAGDASSRFEVMRDTDTLMIWQSMLRGVGIYSGCTRCYDVCPVGDDYDDHLREVQQDIAEETPQKRERLAKLAASRAGGSLPPGLERHARWIGELP
jgi:epoxyqueuosine reductase